MSGRATIRLLTANAIVLSCRHPMKVHINLANVTVVLVVLLLSGLLVHLGSSRLLGRGSRDNTAAFVFLVGPDTERENRTRGLGIALHTLYHHYQVTPPPPFHTWRVTLASCGISACYRWHDHG